MEDATTLLFDLPGFRVVSCEETGSGGRRLTVMQVADEHACPRCGVLVGDKPYDVRLMRIKDVPFGHRPLQVIWRKRRYRCAQAECRQRVFTERSAQLPPRHRLTGRLRRQLERSASRSGRALLDVAAEYGVSWWSVSRALLARAVETAPAALPPVRLLGSMRPAPARRWSWVDGVGWRLANPWMTSFVDLDLDRPGWLLGLVPGRSGAAVQTWLAARDEAWRAAVDVVALDPSAPFAAAIRRLLPRATVVVDHWHLVRLANQMVTEVRQRVARELLGRRGRKPDPAWAHRRLLLAAGDRLGRHGLARLRHVFAVDDPTGEIAAAWAVKEMLRALLVAREPADIRHRLFRFYEAVLAVDLPEATRLAETVQTWWPAMLAFLRLRVTNARTEGSNRIIKQIKRTGCGYRNQANYERRIVLHVAAKNAA